MVRKYKRKTVRGRIIDDVMERSVKKVLDENHSRKSVSDDFSILIKTLSRYCDKYINKILKYLIALLDTQNQGKYF